MAVRDASHIHSERGTRFSLTCHSFHILCHPTRFVGDAISEKSGTDCKGVFHYFCHTGHSEVTEKVKIFG